MLKSENEGFPQGIDRETIAEDSILECSYSGEKLDKTDRQVVDCQQPDD
jgi:hypothetical protein